jgi:hypothetical protein
VYTLRPVRQENSKVYKTPVDKLAADARDVAVDAAVAITAQLLGLLVTFIGEPLTVRLVREAWPDASWGKIIPENGW